MSSVELDWRFVDSADYNMLNFFFIYGEHSVTDLFNIYLMGGEI